MIDLVSDFLHLGQIATNAIETVHVEAFRLDPPDDLVDKRRHVAFLFLAEVYQIRAEYAFFKKKKKNYFYTFMFVPLKFKPMKNIIIGQAAYK